MKIVVGKSDEVLDTVAIKFQQNPTGMMGPFYVGALFEWLFFGVLCNQVWNYYTFFPKDSRWIKRLVGILCFLSLLKSIQAFTITWDKNIVGFGNWRVAASVPWNIWIQPPASMIVSTVAQSFFVWRCFTLTGRNWWLFGVLTTCMLTAVSLSLGLAVHYIYDPFNNERVVRLAVPMLIIATAVDVVITVVVSYRLAKSRTGFSRDTDTVLKRLMAITWEAAIPPAISQMINMILFLTMGDDNTWHGLFNMVTCSLYSFSLMHTLNSRANIRLASSMGTSHDQAQQQTGAVTFDGAPRRSGNFLSLSTFRKKEHRTTMNPTGTMPVHVQTETFIHTSDADTHINVQSALGHQGAISGPNSKNLSASTQSEDGESVASSRWEKPPATPADDEVRPFDAVQAYPLETKP